MIDIRMNTHMKSKSKAPRRVPHAIQQLHNILSVLQHAVC